MQGKQHVCPWWMGYLLASPVRRLFQNPEKIVGPYLRKGMRVLEIGPGMGFFTIPMARMVGEQGKIYCIDIQQKMLDALFRRAKKAGLADGIECRLSPPDSLGVTDFKDSIDLAVAIAVVHEVPDSRTLFREIHSCLKENGQVLVAEPLKRVTDKEFGATLSAASEAGLQRSSSPPVSGFRCALLHKRISGI
jgi:ubiquinone/menaquinone biosynthesis C-methylase UbiE